MLVGKSVLEMFLATIISRDYPVHVVSTAKHIYTSGPFYKMYHGHYDLDKVNN